MCGVGERDVKETAARLHAVAGFSFFMLTAPPFSFLCFSNSLSLSLLQVVEASSSSDDDSSSDSEGAVATPAAGKKEVSFFSWSEA